MNFSDWYTDRMDVFRVVAVQEGTLTRHERQNVAQGIPCRLYPVSERSLRTLSMTMTAAKLQNDPKILCGIEEDIRPGDELQIQAGGGLEKPRGILRAFAKQPLYYNEPLGAVTPGLAHQEIRITQEEWV